MVEAIHLRELGPEGLRLHGGAHHQHATLLLGLQTGGQQHRIDGARVGFAAERQRHGWRRRRGCRRRTSGGSGCPGGRGIITHVHEAIPTHLGQGHQGIFGRGIAQGHGHRRAAQAEVAAVPQHHRSHRHIPQRRCHGPGLQRWGITGLGQRPWLAQVELPRLGGWGGGRREAQDQVAAIGTHQRAPQGHPSQR